MREMTQRIVQAEETGRIVAKESRQVVMREEEKEEKLEEVKSLFLDVTDETKELSVSWNSFDLFNDGPDPTYVAVNTSQPMTEAPIKMGESIEVGTGEGEVTKVWLWCDEGDSANVRIFYEKRR